MNKAREISDWIDNYVKKTEINKERKTIQKEQKSPEKKVISPEKAEAPLHHDYFEINPRFKLLS